MDLMNHYYWASDRKIAQAVCFQIMIVGIKNMLVQSIPTVYAINSYINLVLLALVGIVYIRAYINMDRKLHRRVFFMFCFLILSFVFTLICFPTNKVYILAELPRALPYCFITCYMISALRDLKWIEYYMEKFSIVLIFFSMVSALFIFRIGHITTSTWSTYSMPLSYVTMLAVMWLLHRFFEENRYRFLLLSFVGVVIIIVYGSRNPLLAIVSYIAVNTFIKIREDNSIHKIFYIVGAVIGCLAMIFYKEILETAGIFLSKYNITSRSIYLLTQSTIDLTGRDEIHSTLWAALNSKPLIGYGVFGDQVVLENVKQSAHSLYLSILSNFGYIIGIIVLVVLLYWNYQALCYAEKRVRKFLLIYMCMVWPRGFTGGDVWTSDVFWWLLGMVLSILNFSYQNNLCEGESYD